MLPSCTGRRFLGHLPPSLFLAHAPPPSYSRRDLPPLGVPWVISASTSLYKITTSPSATSPTCPPVPSAHICVRAPRRRGRACPTLAPSFAPAMPAVSSLPAVNTPFIAGRSAPLSLCSSLRILPYMPRLQSSAAWPARAARPRCACSAASCPSSHPTLPYPRTLIPLTLCLLFFPHPACLPACPAQPSIVPRSVPRPAAAWRRPHQPS